MKRFICLLMAVILVCSCLTGCSDLLMLGNKMLEEPPVVDSPVPAVSSQNYVLGEIAFSVPSSWNKEADSSSTSYEFTNAEDDSLFVTGTELTDVDVNSISNEVLESLAYWCITESMGGEIVYCDYVNILNYPAIMVDFYLGETPSMAALFVKQASLYLFVYNEAQNGDKLPEEAVDFFYEVLNSITENAPSGTGNSFTPPAVDPVEGFRVGETAATSNYTVTMTEVKEASDSLLPPDPGFVYVGCYFEVQNTSGEEVAISSALCFEAYADDYSVDQEWFASDAFSGSTLDATLPDGKKCKGFVCFEVPSDYQKLEIIFSPDFIEEFTFVHTK